MKKDIRRKRAIELNVSAGLSLSVAEIARTKKEMNIYIAHVG